MINFSTLDARDYIVLAGVLVGFYLVFLLLPLLRMARNLRQAVAPVRPEGSPPWLADYAIEADSYCDLQRKELQLPASGGPLPALDKAQEGASSIDFYRKLVHTTLELEVRRLRREVEQLRAELTQLREGMRNLQATQNVSPQYSEAMNLAQQGEPPTGIAVRCGISIGEAELVAALARSKTGFESREQENDRNDRDSGSGK